MFKRNSTLSLLTAAAFPMFAVEEGVAAAAVSPEPVAPIKNGREVSYFFKTSKVKDDEGKVIGDGRKHPDVKAVLPMPTELEAIEFLSHAADRIPEEGKKPEELKPTPEAKVAMLIMESLYDLVIQAGRAQINEFLEKNPEGTFTATNFDLSKLTLEYISTLEKGQRGAWAPSEDDLKSFCEDYTNVFVHIVSYDPKKVKVHCDQFTKGLSKLKADKIAVQKMKDFLVLYASKTTNMEVNAETYGWLMARADRYLKAEEKNFADAL